MTDPIDELTKKINDMQIKLDTLTNIMASRLNMPAPPTPPKVQSPRQLFGGKGRLGPVQVKDTKTGVVYPSLTAAGVALAYEIGEKPADPVVFYKLERAFPGRFQRM